MLYSINFNKYCWVCIAGGKCFLGDICVHIITEALKCGLNMN